MTYVIKYYTLPKVLIALVIILAITLGLFIGGRITTLPRGTVTSVVTVNNTVIKVTTNTITYLINNTLTTTVISTVTKTVASMVPIIINTTVIKWINITNTVTAIKYIVINYTFTKTVSLTYIVTAQPLQALTDYYGHCYLHIIILPNLTVWTPMLCLINPRQFDAIWNASINYPLNWFNETTHVAEGTTIIFIKVYNLTTLTSIKLSIGFYCWVINYTFNGYWPVVCINPLGAMGVNISFYGMRIVGDRLVYNKSGLSGNGFTNNILALPINGTMTLPMTIISLGSLEYPGMLFPVTITVTLARNATAAYYLPVTTNSTVIWDWRRAVIMNNGSYNPLDDIVGYWVSLFR